MLRAWGQDREESMAALASHCSPPAQLVLVKLCMFGLGRSECPSARAGSLLGTVSQAAGVGPEPRPGLGSGAGWRAPRPPLEAACCGVCAWPQQGARQGGLWVRLPTLHRRRAQSSLASRAEPHWRWGWRANHCIHGCSLLGARDAPGAMRCFPVPLCCGQCVRQHHLTGASGGAWRGLNSAG